MNYCAVCVITSLLHLHMQTHLQQREWSKINTKMCIFAPFFLQVRRKIIQNLKSVSLQHTHQPLCYIPLASTRLLCGMESVLGTFLAHYDTIAYCTSVRCTSKMGISSSITSQRVPGSYPAHYYTLPSKCYSRNRDSWDQATSFSNPLLILQSWHGL